MAEVVVPETAAPAPATPAKPVGPVTLQQVRDAWPEVLSSLQRTKRSAWMVAFTAQVRDFRDDDVLVLTFPSEHDVAGFRGGAPGQSVSELLRGAIVEVLGVRVKFVARVDGPGGSPAAAPPAPATPPAPAEPQTSVEARGSSAGAPPESSTARPSSSVSEASATTAPAASSQPSASAAAAPARAQTSAAPTGPVDSWATVAIPRDPVAGAESASSGTGTATAVIERPQAGSSAQGAPDAPTVAPEASARVDVAPLPDDADAPPEDEEPPFDPGPEPEVIVEASAPAAAAPAAAPASARATARTNRPQPTTAGNDGGIQRYGEAVVREVLGATFLEEVEAPQRPGFGERG